MNRLVIIGASGHGKVVADIAKLSGYEDIVFLDDNSELTTCAGFPVIGPSSHIDETTGDVFVAVGNNQIRSRLMTVICDRSIPVLRHPNSIIAEDVKIGRGTVVMAGAIINSGALIGEGCIINTSSSVDHDCTVGMYCHISVGAHLCGTVNVGTKSWVGAGATVINNINICHDCLIGAGATVIEDIVVPGTYVGVPAKRK
jgi:sugar O-acyltransferase (sialic acid O-acetyltransferase NeuD family)